MNQSLVKKTTVIPLFVVLCSLVFLPDVAAQNEVELSLRLHNQQIYFPGDSISVRLTIQNNSPNVYRFKFSDERLYNLDFDVRSMDNIEAEPSPQFITLESISQRVFYRGVELMPGEEFSFTEDISQYRILESGIYMMQARFFPELRGLATQRVLNSNSLTVFVREGFRREEQSQIRIEEAVSAEMRRVALPPDEVVVYTIEARMHSETEKFLQYLDIERLYTSSQQRREQYSRLSAFGRQEVLTEYEQELLNDETSGGISLIPSDYRILQTSYSPSRGTVTVEQRYDLGSYVEIKRFTYELERRDGIWYIVRYQVVNLGTE